MPDSDTAAQAKRTVVELYHDLAASESLTRALIAERNGDRELALMWIDIYGAICRDEARLPNSEIVRL